MSVPALQDYVARHAQACPDDVAVVMHEERLTYGDLDRSSTRLARLLREAGCGAGDRVALLLPKAPDSIVAMVAALKAGCAYVPLDTAAAAPRLGRILQSTGPRAILATPASAVVMDQIIAAKSIGCDVTVVASRQPFSGTHFTTEFSRRDWETLPSEPVPVTLAPGDPAHILFTSGFTGAPQGVVVTHANVIHFVEWAIQYFSVQRGDRISGHPPLHFDLSTFDIFGTFAAGAQLHLVPPALNLLPHLLAGFIRDSELTQWSSVPAALIQLAGAGALRQGDFPGLKRVLSCGEVLPTPVLMHWMQRLPHARFTNLYGLTETTIASSYHTVTAPPTDARVPVPIGIACPGEELLVLDEDQRATPAGQVGDLYIAGAGLSPGYWRDEERTRAAFVPDPRAESNAGRLHRTGDRARVAPDGVVHFLGRSDSQITSRGRRIELGEIEQALHALAGVRECAVTAVEGTGFEGPTICCAYVPAGGEGAGVGERGLRAALASVLPAHMLPSRWLAMDALPRNANGNTDRRRVKELFQPDPGPGAA